MDGALAGPVFFASAGVQVLTREGFDLTRHPIGRLSTGDLGRLRITTFVLAGLVGPAPAAGVARKLEEGLGRRAVPILIAVLGAGLVLAGLVLAGVFTLDPEHGFRWAPPTVAVNGLAASTWTTVLAPFPPRSA